MKIIIETNKGELADFLKYFYYVEEIAQDSGHNTGEKWDKGKAWKFHDKLLKAQKQEQTQKCDGECNCPDCEPPDKGDIDGRD